MLKTYLKKIIVGAVKYTFKPFIVYLKDPDFRLRSIYTRYYEKLKIKDNYILYESYHGKNMTCNPYAIFKSIYDDPEYKDYIHIWAIRKSLNVDNPYYQKYKNDPRVKFIEVHSRKYLKALASCKYLINNVTFPAYFMKKEGQIYINTWHGTPLKTLGKDMNGPLGQHGNITRNLLFSDFIINPNRYTANLMIQSFELDGIYSGKIVDAGYPRIDRTLMSTLSNEIKKLIGINENLKVILYAPTWRGITGKVKNSVNEIVEAINKLNANLPEGYQLLVKVHHYVYQYISADKDLFKLCVPDWVDTNELLSLVDVLITDYSSIFFDFLPTRKPVLFYTYDEEEYKRERGLYLDLNEMPGPVCSTIEEIITNLKDLETLKNQYKPLYEKAVEKYNYNDDGHACERFKEIVFKRCKSNFVYKVTNNKKKILIYCGAFLNNGITSSAINLINSIDYNKYEVVVIGRGSHDKETENNAKKLSSKAKVLYRKGSMNIRLFELYYQKYFLKFGISSLILRQIEKIYNREFQRLTGNTHFDVAIDFSGYVPFWTSLIAFGDFTRRLIFQHNDMKSEYNKKINGKYQHKQNLMIVFQLYKFFDRVIAVSKQTLELNLANLKPYMIESKAGYVHNTIDYEKIKYLAAMEGETIEFNKTKYYLFQNSSSSSYLELKGVPYPSKANINFINIGRMSPEKDQEKLIRAFSMVAEKYDNARLYIVGSGVLEKHLKSLVRQLDLSDKVFFTGQLENPFGLLNMCDCFVLSSNHEGQPMVLLEALCLEKPIISTDIPGSRSVLEGGYGLLVENTPEGLAEGMIQFINGQLSFKKFDYIKYNQEALAMFYREIEGIKN